MSGTTSESFSGSFAQYLKNSGRGTRKTLEAWFAGQKSDLSGLELLNRKCEELLLGNTPTANTEEEEIRKNLLQLTLKSYIDENDPAADLGKKYREELLKRSNKIQGEQKNTPLAVKVWGFGESEEQKIADQLSLIAREVIKLDEPRKQLEEKADKLLKRANEALELLNKNKTALEDQQKSQANSKSQKKDFDSAIKSITSSINDLKEKKITLETAKDNTPKNPYADNYQSGQQKLESASNALQKTISQSVDRKNLRAAFYVLKKTSPDKKPIALSAEFIGPMKNEPTALKRLESIESKITTLNENIQRLNNITDLMASKESSELYHDEYRALLEAIQAQSKDLRKDLENEDIQKTARAISDKGDRNNALNTLRKLSNQTAELMHDSRRAIHVQDGSLAEDQRAQEEDSTSLDVDDSHSASARNEISRACVITYYERVPKENGMGHEFKKRTITDLTLGQTRNLAELWNGEAGWNYCKEKGIEWHPVDISNNFFNDGFRLRFDNKELKNEFITGFKQKIMGDQKTSVNETAADGTVTAANPASTLTADSMRSLTPGS